MFRDHRDTRVAVFSNTTARTSGMTSRGGYPAKLPSDVWGF